MNVGDKIKVVVRWKDDWLFAKTPYKDYVQVGTVVKSPSWAPEGTFDLLTGNPEFPVSTIPLDKVVSWEKVGSVKGAPKSNDTKYVIVKGSKDDHRVSLHSSGLVTCDCTGYFYRHKCKHRDQTLTFLNGKYGKNWKNEVFK